MSDTAKPRGERHDGWTRERRAIFLEVLTVAGCVTTAALAAGKGKSTAYTLRRRDEAFAEAWELALQSAADDFETQLRNRVLNGVERKLHHNGQVFATEQVFSDNLAVYMLSRLRPVAVNPNTARREKQRPARDICDRLTAGAVRALKARAGRA